MAPYPKEQSHDAKASSKAIITLDRSSRKRGISEYVALWFWIGWMNFYFFFPIAFPVAIAYWRYTYIPLTIIVGLMMLSAITSIDKKKQPKWALALGQWAMERAANYFHYRMVVEDKEALEKSGQAIFALEPHDVLPLSIFAFNDSLKGFNGHKCVGCLTSACFKVPLMRHVYTWVNAASVDKKNMLKMLGNGYSPVLCPGGVQEVTLMEREDECVLYLRTRFGFVKLALQQGIPLVPCFSFGLRDSYSYWMPKGKWFAKLGRKIGFLPMLIFGVWGVPMGPSKPCDYSTVVGKPIVCPKIAEPTEADLRKYQAIYIDETIRIFETYKTQFGMEKISLRVL